MTTPAPTAGPPAPPPIGVRGLAVRAALEGKAAALEGASYHACPYAASRPFTRRAWLAGYVAGRQEAGVELEVDPDPVAPWPGDE